jgi:hypothetical protein
MRRYLDACALEWLSCIGLWRKLVRFLLGVSGFGEWHGQCLRSELLDERIMFSAISALPMNATVGHAGMTAPNAPKATP